MAIFYTPVETDRERFERVFDALPDWFGLRAFPGRTFGISYLQSQLLQGWGTTYTSDDDVVLYLMNDRAEAFAKGTRAELLREMTPDPNPTAVCAACGHPATEHAGGNYAVRRGEVVRCRHDYCHCPEFKDGGRK